MRVLWLADRLSQRGGADWHLLGVLGELAGRGVQVELAAGKLDLEGEPPCPVHQLPALAARGRRPIDLRPLLDRFAPELLHLQNVMNPTALELVAESRLPALVTVQDHRFFCPGRGKWTAAGEVCREPMSRARCAGCFEEPAYFEAIFRLTEERLQAVRRLSCLVLSRYMASELLAVGLPADQVHCLPPFVHGLQGRGDPGRRVDGEEPGVLFAGRLVAAKGVADAVEIWRRARTALPLRVAGSGPERGRLPADAGLQPLGWVSHGELGQLLRRSRALLLPSRWQEPFGIVGLEALSLGVPVVAWRSGGIDEWHPGGLCEWGDLDGMTAALRAVLQRPPAAELPASFEKTALMGQLIERYRRAAALEHG